MLTALAIRLYLLACFLLLIWQAFHYLDFDLLVMLVIGIPFVLLIILIAGSLLGQHLKRRRIADEMKNPFGDMPHRGW